MNNKKINEEVESNITSDVFLRPIDNKILDDFIEKNGEFLDEILEYGIYILDLINNEHKNSYSDATILFILRDILEIIDGINELFKKSCIDVSVPLLRNLFELFLSLSYILETHTEKRALAYQIGHTHEKIQLYKKLENDKNLSKNIPKNINLDSMISNLNNLLKRTEYSTIEQEYKRTKKKINNKKKSRRDIEPKWYSLYNGPSNIYQLSKHLKMDRYYNNLYSPWSSKVHGTSALNNLNNVSGMPTIKSPRYPKNIYTYTNIMVSMIVILYKKIIQYYLKQEDIDNCITWYNNIKKSQKELEQIWSRFKFV
jgi:hypothetical protein